MTDARDFATHFATLELDAENDSDFGETIVPAWLKLSTEPVEVLQTLPRMSLEDTPGTIPDLRVVGTLGEGGMGLVRLATQVVLQRDVAVKTVRSKRDGAGPKLLQEAYVTGRLEHPNIIPIYTLGRDDDGAPLIVMKRIEGVSWLEVLLDPDKAPEDTEPSLAWNLDLLVQVCNAVRYAHSRNIVHRDIKPENVMIGTFGEVYLLDWGIAVSIDEEPEESVLPHKSKVQGMAGTPCYMAPEMTDDTAEAVDERTDVYLLGATLHELLTGTPRHHGSNLFEVMKSAFESEPIEYDESVPQELGEIANRATSYDPDDRFPSVEAFQHALQDYLDHRASYELVEEARSLLRTLRPMIETHELDRGEDDELEIRNLLVECRFACRQALKSWSENPLAHAAQRDYLELTFHHSVQIRDALAAQAALASLEEDGERPELREELSKLSNFLDAERKEFEGLREFASQLDLSHGRVSRSLAVLLMGAAWALTNGIAWFRARDGGIDLYSNHVNSIWRVLTIGGLALFVFRKKLFSTAGNRRIAFLLIMTLVSVTTFRALAYLYPAQNEAVQSFEIAMYGLAGMAAGIASDDRRIALLGLVYLPVALSGYWIGNDQVLLNMFAHIIFFGGIAWFWTPSQIRNRWRI